LITLLPFWIWALIIIFFGLTLTAIAAAVTDGEESGGCLTTLTFVGTLFVWGWFADFYEETEYQELRLDAVEFEEIQHQIWTNDTISFLSERLSARKKMEDKIREDSLSYSPVVTRTIDLLESQIRDYQFRTFALKDTLIDSNIRQGITTKRYAKTQREDYGILVSRSTGIAEIDPDNMSIKTINKGTPASDAGLAVGDIITEIIRHDAQDWKIMEESDIGTLTGNYLYRGQMAIKIRPKEERRSVGKIGVYTSRDFYAGTPVIRINEIIKGDPADLVGLMVGDLIVKINDSELLHHSDFTYYFLNLDTVESTKLGIIRNEVEIDITIKNKILTEKEYIVPLVARGIPYMIDETYFEWVKLTDALKLSLEMMKLDQKRLYILRRKNELSPDKDKNDEIDKLILEAKRTADRNIQLFKLEESNE